MKKVRLNNNVIILAKISCKKSNVYRDMDVMSIHVYSGDDETKNNKLLFTVQHGGSQDKKLIIGKYKNELDIFELNVFMELYENFTKYYIGLQNL